MILFETIAVAFAMFSALPVPQPVWNDKNMRYALCAFPLVGVATGLCWWGWSALCGWLGLPMLLRAAGLCMLPAAVSGGIPLDGYADTGDALASCASPEKKKEILDDPNCGAFAVIRLCMYFTGYFALCGTVRLGGRELLCMGLSFVLSRALSGFAIGMFPLSKNTGLAHAFATEGVKTRGRLILGGAAVLLMGAMCLAGGWYGAAMSAAALLVLWWYHHTAMSKFGGLSGDLAGWFLQKAEFWMLAALVACQSLEGLV